MIIVRWPARQLRAGRAVVVPHYGRTASRYAGRGSARELTAFLLCLRREGDTQRFGQAADLQLRHQIGAMNSTVLGLMLRS